MLNVNDYKLVPLDTLVHDEALFESYKEFISALRRIYEIQSQYVIGEIDLGEDYVFEDNVLEKEACFWRSAPDGTSPRQLLDWAFSDLGFGYRKNNYEDQDVAVSLFIHLPGRVVLGRSNLYFGQDKNIIRGAGFDCIHPDFRGQNLGHMILAHRLDQARQTGLFEMRLNVREDNTASMRRIEKLEAAGLTYDHRWTGDREIKWIKPSLTARQAYAILAAPRSAPANDMDLSL